MSLRVAQAALLSLSAMLWPGLVDASPLVSRALDACKLKANQGVLLSSGFGYQKDCVSSVGAVTAFMMFVDFPDSPHFEESPQDLADVFLPDAVKWFESMSYNKLELKVTADVTKFYRMAGSSDSYNYGEENFSNADHERYIMDALNAYTFNGQFVNASEILYIVPTASAKHIGSSFTLQYRLNGHDGKMMYRRIITFGQDALDTYGFPMLNHETCHAFCLADLYPSTGNRGTYVGGWDLMGLEDGASPDLFAWDKWRLGWLADHNIDCVSAKGTTKHVLTALYDETPGTKAVVVARDKVQVLVAEARFEGGVDAATCNPGVLLYTVSVNVPHLQGPILVLDANPHTSGCDNIPLNDATISLNGTKSINVEDWGVTVEVIEQTERNITINVAYQ